MWHRCRKPRNSVRSWSLLVDHLPPPTQPREWIALRMRSEKLVPNFAFSLPTWDSEGTPCRQTVLAHFSLRCARRDSPTSRSIGCRSGIRRSCWAFLEKLVTYVAFLRAINVAGHAIVKMTDLKDTFTTAGCENVRTFIQSGNIIFECSEEKSQALFKRIHKAVKELLGVEATIVFRTLTEIEAIV